MKCKWLIIPLIVLMVMAYYHEIGNARETPSKAGVRFIEGNPPPVTIEPPVTVDPPLTTQPPVTTEPPVITQPPVATQPPKLPSTGLLSALNLAVYAAILIWSALVLKIFKQYRKGRGAYEKS